MNLLYSVIICLKTLIPPYRFIAIKLPVYHVTWLTYNRAVVANVVIWTVSTVIGLLPLFGWNTLNQGL